MRHTIALACFFLSGFAALVYEVCWIRTASLVFGSTTYAVSTVLAVFFAGLAIGYHGFARWSERTRRPLFWFGVLEMTVGAFALATPLGFALADHIYGWAYRSAGDSALVLTAMRVVLVGAVLLVPTIAMGGTLPLVCRHFVHQPQRIARMVGVVYALNTVGAALGCLTCGMVLIPTIGVDRAIQLAAAVSLAVGAVVTQLRIPLPEASSEPPRAARAGRRLREKEPAPEGPVRLAPVYMLFFLVGLVALANEVLWTRYLGLVIRTTDYTYTMTLTVVLAGIAAGSAIASRWFDRSHAKVFWFGLVQVALGLVVLTTLLLPVETWKSFAGGDLWTCGWLLAPAAVLGGLAFPLAVRIVTTDPQRAGPNTGRLAAVNTVGGIVGSLVMGFAALPLLGMQVCVLVTSALSLVGGFAAWLFLDRPAGRALRVTLIVGASLLWVGIPLRLGTKLPGDFLAPPGRLIDYREGLASNVAVVQRDEAITLEIDRWWQGEDRKNHQIMAAHLPMLLHPGAERVLVVGGGTGQTLSRFLMYDVAALDCVEIEPAVFDILPGHFDAAWMDDERVHIIYDDGRNFLTHTDAKYDVISLELGQIFRPGVASFYTADFYRQARERLADDGILCQFVPVPFFRPDEFRSVLQTFQEVFPTCYLWYNTAELLLIGSPRPLQIEAGQVEATWSPETIHEDLRYSPWGGPDQWLFHTPVLLSYFLAGPEEVAALAEGGTIYRDDRPVLEYRVGQVRTTEVNEEPDVRLLRRHLADVSAIYEGTLTEEEVDAIDALREKNVGDMVGTGYGRGVTMLEAVGDYAAMVRLLSKALAWNTDNVKHNRLLGEALVKLKRYDEARVYLERAAAVNPDDPLVQRGLAAALHQSNRQSEAIEHYQAALRYRPDDPELHNNLGVALAQLDRIDEAVEHFRRAVALDPNYADARRNLGRATRLTGSAAPPRASGVSP